MAAGRLRADAGVLRAVTDTPSLPVVARSLRRCGNVIVTLTLLGSAVGPVLAQPVVRDGDTDASHGPAAAGTKDGAATAAPSIDAGPPPGPDHGATDTARSSVWRDLFGRAAGDIRRLPSARTAELLTIGAIAAAGVRPADSHVSRSISGVMKLHEPLEPGAVLGSTPFQMAGSLATYGIARWTGNARLAVVGADLFRAQLVAEGLTVGMKQSFRRKRPEGGGFAFPSGHTTVSFASATVLRQHFGWRVGAPAYGIAAYVALSRVQMKRHYLSDVAFGAALGIAAGRTVALGSAHRMQLAPLIAEGGGGVQFTWLGR